MLGSLFNNVAALEACNFTEKRLQHSCFPLSIAKFLIAVFYRTPPVAATRVYIKWEQNHIAIRPF